MNNCSIKCKNNCQVNCLTDNPELDATDGAHPAWWRGCDYGCEIMVQNINKIIDALESGKNFNGNFANRSLEDLKNRINKLYINKNL